MTFRVIFHPLADKEFNDAYQWYEQRLEGLGERFSEAIEHRLDQIVNDPLLFPETKNSYRAAKAETFPYLIVYKIDHKKKAILISAIYHTSRNPKKKYRK